MVALVGVLLLGILKGVLLATVVSILMFLGRVSRPHVAFLGRIPGTQRFSDLARHPDNAVVPGVVIVRVEAPLIYFNAGYVSEAVRHKVHSEATPVHLVVWIFPARLMSTWSARACWRIWKRSGPDRIFSSDWPRRTRTCVICCALRDLRHGSAGSTAGHQWKTSLQRFDQCRSAHMIRDTYTEGTIQHRYCDVDAKVRGSLR